MKAIILSLLGTAIFIVGVLVASICFNIGCYLEGVTFVLAALALIYLLFRFFLKRTH